MIVEI